MHKGCSGGDCVAGVLSASMALVVAMPAARPPCVGR